MNFLDDTYHRLLADLPETKRYLYDSFELSGRLVGLVGARGVGKTTLMLQYIKHKLNPESAFYFSADNLFFNQNTLFSFIVKKFTEENITQFFVDEIHQYQNWEQELKNIHDSYPELSICYSGSSSIEIKTGSYDLSRRTVLFHLNGLSFREYLQFKYKHPFEKICFYDLIKKPSIYNDYLQAIPKLLGDFRGFIQHGYYPFYFDDPNTFYQRLGRVMDKIIYEDIPHYYSLKTENLHKFKEILSYLCSIPPGTVNINNLSKSLGLDNKTISHYLEILSTMGLIMLISQQGGGTTSLRKQKKIFLNNSALQSQITSMLDMPANIGSLREVVFLRFLQDCNQSLSISKVGDFCLDDIVFEIGGSNKSSKQIRQHQGQKFLIKDNMLTATKGAIPLHFFGFIQ